MKNEAVSCLELRHQILPLASATEHSNVSGHCIHENLLRALNSSVYIFVEHTILLQQNYQPFITSLNCSSCLISSEKESGFSP